MKPTRRTIHLGWINEDDSRRTVTYCNQSGWLETYDPASNWMLFDPFYRACKKCFHSYRRDVAAINNPCALKDLVPPGFTFRDLRTRAGRRIAADWFEENSEVGKAELLRLYTTFPWRYSR